MVDVASDARGYISFIAFVVGLILKENEFIGFVIRTVVGEVGHDK